MSVYVSLDRYRAYIHHGPRDVIYFLKAMTNSFQTSISKVYILLTHILQVASFFVGNNMYSGLHKLLQPCSRAARKWRENEEMKRKWREYEEIERKWRESEEMNRE